MSNIDRSSSIDMLTPTTMSLSAMPTSGHDDGLSHDHHWARESAGERRSHPRVADISMMSTPSSVMHDDIHYSA